MARLEKIIKIRIDEETYSFIEDFASRRGLSFSDGVRMLLERSIRSLKNKLKK